MADEELTNLGGVTWIARADVSQLPSDLQAGQKMIDEFADRNDRRTISLRVDTKSDDYGADGAVPVTPQRPFGDTAAAEAEIRRIRYEVDDSQLQQTKRLLEEIGGIVAQTNSQIEGVKTRLDRPGVLNEPIGHSVGIVDPQKQFGGVTEAAVNPLVGGTSANSVDIQEEVRRRMTTARQQWDNGPREQPFNENIERGKISADVESERKEAAPESPRPVRSYSESLLGNADINGDRTVFGGSEVGAFYRPQSVVSEDGGKRASSDPTQFVDAEARLNLEGARRQWKAFQDEVAASPIEVNFSRPHGTPERRTAGDIGRIDADGNSVGAIDEIRSKPSAGKKDDSFPETSTSPAKVAEEQNLSTPSESDTSTPSAAPATSKNEEEEPRSQRGGRSFLGRGFGRIATAYYGIEQLESIGGIVQDHEIETMNAGRDQSAILSADLKENDAIEQSGIFGKAIGFLRDSGGTRRAEIDDIRGTVQARNDQTEMTAGIGNLYREAGQSVGISSERNPYEKQRREAEKAKEDNERALLEGSKKEEAAAREVRDKAEAEARMAAERRRKEEFPDLGIEIFSTVDTELKNSAAASGNFGYDAEKEKIERSLSDQYGIIKKKYDEAVAPFELKHQTDLDRIDAQETSFRTSQLRLGQLDSSFAAGGMSGQRHAEGQLEIRQHQEQDEAERNLPINPSTNKPFDISQFTPGVDPRSGAYFPNVINPSTGEFSAPAADYGAMLVRQAGERGALNKPFDDARAMTRMTLSDELEVSKLQEKGYDQSAQVDSITNSGLEQAAKFRQQGEPDLASQAIELSKSRLATFERDYARGLQAVSEQGPYGINVTSPDTGYEQPNNVYAEIGKERSRLIAQGSPPANALPGNPPPDDSPNPPGEDHGRPGGSPPDGSHRPLPLRENPPSGPYSPSSNNDPINRPLPSQRTPLRTAMGNLVQDDQARDAHGRLLTAMGNPIITGRERDEQGRLLTAMGHPLMHDYSEWARQQNAKNKEHHDPTVSGVTWHAPLAANAKGESTASDGHWHAPLAIGGLQSPDSPDGKIGGYETHPAYDAAARSGLSDAIRNKDGTYTINPRALPGLSGVLTKDAYDRIKDRAEQEQRHPGTNGRNTVQGYQMEEWEKKHHSDDIPAGSSVERNARRNYSAGELHQLGSIKPGDELGGIVAREALTDSVKNADGTYAIHAPSAGMSAVLSEEQNQNLQNATHDRYGYSPNDPNHTQSAYVPSPGVLERQAAWEREHGIHDSGGSGSGQTSRPSSTTSRQEHNAHLFEQTSRSIDAMMQVGSDGLFKVGGSSSNGSPSSAVTPENAQLAAMLSLLAQMKNSLQIMAAS